MTDSESSKELLYDTITIGLVKYFHLRVRQTRQSHNSQRTTSGPVSTEMGNRVRIQFPVPDTYFGM